MMTNDRGVSSQAMRDTLMAELAVQVKALFDACPEVQTVGYFVAQYWAGAAEDEVHASVRISTEITTHTGLLKDIYDDDGDDNWTRLATKAEPLYPSVGDDNNGMVVAFAAYATKSNQREPVYTPYALFHRRGSSVTTTVVGRMLQPELEDAQPAPPQAKTKGNPLTFIAVVAAWALVTWLMNR